jgi:hypothetical protein
VAFLVPKGFYQGDNIGMGELVENRDFESWIVGFRISGIGDNFECYFL